ncbi:MAG: YkgJ family cysteine cluster protein, partial [Acidobacteriota bacterium]|nr:YkgJ family cysteine cluster protein [Acidobacteriota bacterium]
DCCRNHDNYSYVYLDSAEAVAISGHLGISLEAFCERYTAVEDGDLILRMDQPDCPFLDGARCSIYESRPTQCRTFPFWPENLTSRKRWNDLAGFCPGIDRGTLIPVETILTTAQEHETRHDEE